MLTTQNAVLAAATTFPIRVQVNANGKSDESVCSSKDDVRDFLTLMGFRNSIDDATIVPVN